MTMPGMTFRSSFTGCLRRWYSRGADSPNWLHRQRTDPYVRRARIESWRCRSAFKLLEVDQRYHLLSPGMRVLDCGAAPGSWSQVAVSRVRPELKAAGPGNIEPANPGDDRRGLVIAVDIQHFNQIPGAVCLTECDVTAPDTLAAVRDLLGDRPLDLVLSDMAPNASGIKEVDMLGITRLAHAALQLALRLSRPGGSFLVKLWAGSNQAEFQQLLQRFYNEVRLVKPPSSRSDSAEIFFLARGYTPPQINN